MTTEAPMRSHGTFSVTQCSRNWLQYMSWLLHQTLLEFVLTRNVFSTWLVLENLQNVFVIFTSLEIVTYLFVMLTTSNLLMLFFTSLCQSLCLRTYTCTDLLSTICHVLCSVSYVLCYIVYIFMTYFTLITTIRKENPDVHTEGRSFSVWRVNGQVPPKQSCFLSHRSIS